MLTALKLLVTVMPAVFVTIKPFPWILQYLKAQSCVSPSDAKNYYVIEFYIVRIQSGMV